MRNVLLVSQQPLASLMGKLDSFNFQWAKSGSEVIELLWDEPYAIAIDIEISPISMDAETLIHDIRLKDPFVSILLVVRAHQLDTSTLPDALRYVKAGASQFIQIPAPEVELLWILSQACDHTYQARKATFYSVQQLKQNTTYKTAVKAYLELVETNNTKGIPVSSSEIAALFPPHEAKPEAFETLSKSTTKKGTDYTLLVVDDEKQIREKALNLFASTYTVFEAEDSTQAFDILEKHPIHLILLDISLPGKRGTEMVAEIKTRWPHIEIIMVTAHSDFGLLASSISDGAFDYVIKPFNKVYLKNSVRRALQHQEFKKVMGIRFF
jgi:DNA-binding NtrC family response regulator